MKIEYRILVAVAAATDAIWMPCRGPHGKFWQVVYERRRSYPKTGVGWRSQFIQPGVNRQDREKPERCRDELIADGFLESFQPNGKRTRGVRLTEMGDLEARELVGLPCFCDMWCALDQLWDLRNSPDGFDECGLAWVPEIEMNSGRGWEGEGEHHKGLITVEDMLIGFMSRGLVVSNSDTRRVYYALTPAGVDAAKRRAKEGRVHPGRKLLDVDQEASDFYRDRYGEAVATLHAAEPENPNELGKIPISCSPILRSFGKRKKQPAA